MANPTGLGEWKLRFVTSLKEHWSAPLHRSTYLFSANQIVGLFSGVIFWVLAARLYTPAQIGEASAFLAPAAFLSTAFLLGANHGLLRYSRQIGEDARLLFSVIWFGAFVSAFGSILGIIICLWVRAIDPISGSILLSLILYAILVSSGTIWTICEAAFISLRAPWGVYVRSLLFALTRIAVLIPFAFLGELGLVMAFSFSMGLAAFVSVELLRRQLRPDRGAFLGFGHPLLRPLLGFAIPNHIVTLIATIPAMMLPLVAIRLLGAETNGYYYMAWTITMVIRAVLSAASSSLLAEGARDWQLLNSRLPRSAFFLFTLTGIAALPMILLPRVVLWIFGGPYADANALALPIFALSILPSIFPTLYVARERILNRIPGILVYSVANCALSIALPYVGAQWGGYSGFALGYLISQWLAGLAVVPFLVRPMKDAGYSAILRPET
jgi:O-antigen/teichoic acid export membrane protein